MSSHILPLVLVRRAALPPGIADHVDLHVIDAAMTKLAVLREETVASAEGISDEIYTLVPRIADRDRRRAAVRLRRDVHNNRLSTRTVRDAESLRPVLSADAAARLDQWLAISRRIADERETVEGLIDEVIRARGQAMFSALKTAELWSGLALASPDYARELAKRAEPGAPGSRFARTLFSYVTRIAMKTSPFSTFTSLGLAGIEGSPASSGADTAVERSVSGPLSVAVDLLHCCAMDRRFEHVVSLLPNPSLHRTGDGGTRALISSRLCQNGFFFTEDEIVDCGGRGEALLRHGGRVGKAVDWRAWLGVPATVVRRLVATGLLLPVAPWTAPEDAFRALAGLARRAHDAAEMAETFEELDRVVSQARTSDWRARVAANETGRARARKAFRHLSVLPPHWIENAPFFHECVSHDGPAITLPRPVMEDLEILRRQLARTTQRSRLYSGLVADFVSRYGRGGTCPDLLSYLTTFVKDDRFGRVLEEIRVHDVRPPAQPQDLRGHGTLGPPTVSVSFQVAAPSVEAVRQGAHHTVVNRINIGSGGMLARWSNLPSLRDHIHDALGGWFSRLHPECLVLQVSAAEDWAPVQRVYPEILPVLGWPSRVPGGPPPERTVELTGMALRHDPESDTLQAFVRDTGQGVAFAYLGVIPQHLINGPRRVLLALSDPWVPPLWAGFGSEGFRRQRPVPEPTSEPRHAVGRLVMKRAVWRLPADALPLRAPDESWLDLLERVTEWRGALSLPERGYARVFTTSDPVGSKPQWIDFMDPWSLSALAGESSGATTLEITEALPDTGEHCWLGGDGLPRTTEFAAFLSLGDIDA